MWSEVLVMEIVEIDNGSVQPLTILEVLHRLHVLYQFSTLILQLPEKFDLIMDNLLEFIDGIRELEHASLCLNLSDAPLASILRKLRWAARWRNIVLGSTAADTGIVLEQNSHQHRVKI